MKFEEIKGSIDSFLDSVAEGWRHLRESAANALTRFLPGEQSRLPPKSEIDDPLYLPVRGWSMLGGEVFEDDTRLVVRIEVPGMDKQDIDIEIRDDALVVSGEKRFERESTEGRWRVMQCAYGSFRRVVPLSLPVERRRQGKLQERRAAQGAAGKIGAEDDQGRVRNNVKK